MWFSVQDRTVHLIGRRVREHRKAITRESMTFRVTAHLFTTRSRRYRAASSFSAATNASTSSSVVSKAHIQRTTPASSSQK